jgi:hypothetical protein
MPDQQQSHSLVKVTGETVDDAVFEFPDATEKQGSVSLKAIVRQFVSSPHLRSVPAKQMYMILGRLRCFHYSVCRYNEGVISHTPIFLLYWRRRTLNLLSGFGFQAASANQQIQIFGLGELIEKIEQIFHEEIRAAQDLIQSGMIIFDALGELYRPFAPLQGKTALGGTPGIFMVVEYFYEEHRSLVGMEKSFHLTLEFIATMGEHFTVVSFTEVLSGWTGVRTRPLSELTYVPLNPADKDALAERGRNYVGFGVGGAKFLAYASGTFFMHSVPKAGGVAMSRGGGSQLNSPGRIMVDPARGALLGHHASQGLDEPTQAMVQLAGRYRRWLNTQSATSGGASDEALTLWQTVPDELALFCWPALVGFSFTAKAWGHVLVSGLAPIAFQDQAFDQLVLAEERKQLIRALVRFGGAGDTDDIVGGKTGGSVFLLHGPPGVGKTLTAEAIAEVLHRPLYYVTMGELGMTPDDMERRLSDVLELCAGWDALVLLDEADVFLETRATSDLARNAMVCVMLRLLEYHPGILFLTTNRVRSFDPAFESRVTVALRYEPLSPAARAQIWRNLLQRVAIPVDAGVAPDALAAHALNGRQIKNAVRLAAALARERGGAVTQEILETTLRITSLGRQEMREDDSWKG